MLLWRSPKTKSWRTEVAIWESVKRWPRPWTEGQKENGPLVSRRLQSPHCHSVLDLRASKQKKFKGGKGAKCIITIEKKISVTIKLHSKKKTGEPTDGVDSPEDTQQATTRGSATSLYGHCQSKLIAARWGCDNHRWPQQLLMNCGLDPEEKKKKKINSAGQDWWETH